MNHRPVSFTIITLVSWPKLAFISALSHCDVSFYPDPRTKSNETSNVKYSFLIVKCNIHWKLANANYIILGCLLCGGCSGDEFLLQWLSWLEIMMLQDAHMIMGNMRRRQSRSKSKSHFLMAWKVISGKHFFYSAMNFKPQATGHCFGKLHLLSFVVTK